MDGVLWLLWQVDDKLALEPCPRDGYAWIQATSIGTSNDTSWPPRTRLEVDRDIEVLAMTVSEFWGDGGVAQESSDNNPSSGTRSRKHGEG
jgi:hypothetical protein